MNPEAIAPAQWAATADVRAELAEHGWTIRLGRGVSLRLGPTWVAEHPRDMRLYENELPRLVARCQSRIQR